LQTICRTSGSKCSFARKSTSFLISCSLNLILSATRGAMMACLEPYAEDLRILRAEVVHLGEKILAEAEHDVEMPRRVLEQVDHFPDEQTAGLRVRPVPDEELLELIEREKDAGVARQSCHQSPQVGRFGTLAAHCRSQ
jgi:hypothetical protein